MENIRIITSSNGTWDPPRYIAYDYICKQCPRGDQGDRLLFYQNHPVIAKANDPMPLTYHRMFHDHRYQVYVTDQVNMPPQTSKAGICSFWCMHVINTAPALQQVFFFNSKPTANVDEKLIAGSVDSPEDNSISSFADTPQTSNDSGTFPNNTPVIGGPQTQPPGTARNFRRGYGYRGGRGGFNRNREFADSS